MLGPGLAKQPDFPVAGASAGALAAAAIACNVPVPALLTAIDSTVTELRQHGTWGRVRPQLHRLLDELIPLDGHRRASGRLHLAVAMLPRWLPLANRDGGRGASSAPAATSPWLPHVELVSHFSSRDDLIEALLASCHVPWYLDGRAHTAFRGLPAFDGGFIDFLPIPPTSQRPLRVCCFPAILTAPLAMPPPDIAPTRHGHLVHETLVSL